MNMIDLTSLIQAVIALLAALITYKLIPWIQANTTARQQELLQATIRTLVYAAEQIYGSGTGQQKLEYVQQQLKARGYIVDLATIEASVRQMNITSTASDSVPPASTTE